MPVQKVEWAMLEKFLPPGTLDFVNSLLTPYKLKLTLSLPRVSLLGYYKPPVRGSEIHTITINQNLNPYAFLIVLIHEIAHMQIYVSYGNKVKAHGVEWQHHFGRLLHQAVGLGCFPDGIRNVLAKRILHPRSLRSCTDIELMRQLRQWDKKEVDEEVTYVEDIPIGGFFIDRKGRKMQLIEKRRTRFLCKQEGSGIQYLYPAMLEVKKIV